MSLKHPRARCVVEYVDNQTACTSTCALTEHIKSSFASSSSSRMTRIIGHLREGLPEKGRDVGGDRERYRENRESTGSERGINNDIDRGRDEIDIEDGHRQKT